MAEQKESGPAEGGFVECRFELWKLRSRIVRARSEILATQCLDYNHRFGDFIYQKQCSFNSSYKSGLVSEKKKRKLNYAMIFYYPSIQPYDDSLRRNI